MTELRKRLRKISKFQVSPPFNPSRTPAIIQKANPNGISQNVHNASLVQSARLAQTRKVIFPKLVKSSLFSGENKCERTRTI